MIFRPDIKPPMWGPPDAVRYAVRVNAERMGIDPASFKVFLSFWDGVASPSDIFDNTVNGNGLIPVANGIYISGQQASTTADRIDVVSNPNNFFGTNDTTFFIYAKKIDDISLNELLGLATQTQKRIVLSDDERVNNRCEASTYNGTWSSAQWNSTHMAVNKPDTLALTYAASSGLDLYIGGAKQTKTSDTIGTTFSTTTETRINIGAAKASSSSDAYWGFKGEIYLSFLTTSILSPIQIAQLHATPYALLMPVSRPVYFDLGAGGNTNSSADPGNIAISGSSSTGVQTHISSADSGTVSIAGSVASGIRSLVSLAAAASIAIAGFSAEGVYTPTGSTVSSAGPGAVAISGSPANGVQTHISSAEPGTIAILGSDANAATGYASSAESGAVAITGADATASRTYVATASPTSIAIAGSPAYATKSGGSSTSSGISLIFGKVILHL